MPAVTDILDIPAVRAVAHRIRVEQYHRLTEQGILSKNTELIRGIVLDKMSQSPLHCYVVQMLVNWLLKSLGDGWVLRESKPLTTHDSEPEPDVCVVKGQAADFLTRHPTTAALAAEVAITSEKLDTQKASIYAEAGVDEYWILFPERRCVQVHRGARDGQYAEVLIVDEEGVLQPALLPGAELPVSQLFPPSG